MRARTAAMLRLALSAAGSGGPVGAVSGVAKQRPAAHAGAGALASALLAEANGRPPDETEPQRAIAGALRAAHLARMDAWVPLETVPTATIMGLTIGLLPLRELFLQLHERANASVRGAALVQAAQFWDEAPWGMLSSELERDSILYDRVTCSIAKAASLGESGVGALHHVAERVAAHPARGRVLTGALCEAVQEPALQSSTAPAVAAAVLRHLTPAEVAGADVLHRLAASDVASQRVCQPQTGTPGARRQLARNRDALRELVLLSTTRWDAAQNKLLMEFDALHGIPRPSQRKR